MFESKSSQSSLLASLFAIHRVTNCILKCFSGCVLFLVACSRGFQFCFIRFSLSSRDTKHQIKSETQTEKKIRQGMSTSKEYSHAVFAKVRIPTKINHLLLSGQLHLSAQFSTLHKAKPFAAARSAPRVSHRKTAQVLQGGGTMLAKELAP
jgi:hypothetical protein